MRQWGPLPWHQEFLASLLAAACILGIKWRDKAIPGRGVGELWLLGVTPRCWTASLPKTPTRPFRVSCWAAREGAPGHRTGSVHSSSGRSPRTGGQLLAPGLVLLGGSKDIRALSPPSVHPAPTLGLATGLVRREGGAYVRT